MLVGIKVSVLAHQGVDHRLPDCGAIAYVIAPWETRRTTCRAIVDWRFTVLRAHTKHGPVYLSYPKW